MEDGTVFIKTSGEMYFEPDRNLDHSTLETLNTSITATIVDGDGDTYTPVANIQITDGQDPVITGVTAITLDEANLDDGTDPGGAVVSGSGTVSVTVGSDDIDHIEVDVAVFNAAADITAMGKPVVLGEPTVEVDPQTGVETYIYTGSVTLDDNSVVDVLQISVDGEGNYSFELYEAVDHADGTTEDDALTFNIPVVAVDSDGDKSVSNASTNIAVTILDDEPVIAEEVTLPVTEPVTSGDNATTTHDFLVQEGADGASVVSFVYQGDETSDPFVLDQTETDFQEFAVEDGTVFIKTSGEMYFEPDRNLDHSTLETLNTSITATIVDGDGDTYTPVANIQIIDGQDPVITGVTAITLDEANLDDGTDSSNAVVSGSGTVSVTVGSDDIDHIEVDVAAFNAAADLEAMGKPVVLGEPTVEVDPQTGVETYIYTGSVTLDDNSVVDVLQISVDGEGNYSFELYEAVDHADGTAEDDALTFNIPVVAVDSDGDKSVSNASTNIAVTILDDELIVDDAELTVTEPTIDGENQVTHQVINEPGADGASVVSFVYKGESDTEFTLNPAIANEQEQAFTVEHGTVYITGDGALRFVPDRDLEHPQDSNEILSAIDVTSRDGDGDTEVATIDLTIVDGQIPIITNITAVTLDEANLPNGTDTDLQALVGTGSFSVTVGSDDISHYEIDVVSFNSSNTIQAFGEDITLSSPVIDGDEYTYTGSALVDGNEIDIFTVVLEKSSLNDGNDGKYTFTLLQPITHIEDPVTDGTADDLALAFDFPVYAVDTDLDKSTLTGETEPMAASLSVTILDDEMIVADAVLTVVEPTTAGENEVTHQVLSEEGADGASVVSFIYKGTSDVTFTLDPAVAGEQSFDVEHGTVYLTTEGAFRFVPDRDLEHPVNTNEILSAVDVKVVDGDGDNTVATIDLTIVDGDIPVITNSPVLELDEANLADGTDPDNAEISGSGVFNVNVGSDDVDHFEIDIVDFNNSNTVKAFGELVTLSAPVIDGDEYTYTASVNVNGEIIDVFTITLDKTTANDGNDGSFSFTLLQPVEHIEGDLIKDDGLVFNLPVYAVDTDNDLSTITGETTATATNLAVTIIDDELIVQDNTLEVIEPVIAGDNEVTHQVILKEGADGATVTSFVYNGTASTTYNLNPNTEPTVEQSFSVEHGTVFMTGDGAFRFEPDRDLDHTDSENILSRVDVTATDGDGDTEVSVIDLTIVDGQIPIITGAGSVSFDETNLSDGNEPNAGALTKTGSITATVGSDDISYFELEPSEFNPDGDLLSMGQEVQLEFLGESGGIRSYQGFVEVGGNKVPVFSVELDKPALGQYEITLIEELDHVGIGEDDSLTFDLPVYAVDSDGDRSTITGLTDPTASAIEVTVIDDEPMLFEQNLTRVEGQSRATRWMFDDPSIGGRDNETGADNGVVTSIEAEDDPANNRDIQFRLGDGTLVDSADLNGSTLTVTVVEIVNGVSQDLGSLEIRPDGRARFTPEEFVDHEDSPNLDFSVNVTATDFDQDTSTEKLNIRITDRNAQITDAQLDGVEEAGRDDTNILDNLDGLPADSLEPIKVVLSVDLFDRDRGEEIGNVLLNNIGNHNGTFYYYDSGADSFVALATNSNGATLLADQVEQTIDGNVSTVENLYFVPDRNFSTSESGINIGVNVQILNNDTGDHNVTGQLNINVQSIADKPTWTVDSVFNYTYSDDPTEDRSVDEDGNNVELSIAAETQDTSNPETITYELEFTFGGENAELVYADGTAISATTDPDTGRVYYVVDADRIDEVEVDPIDHFSGQIKLTVTAIAEESENAAAGKETKESDPREIVIDVRPVADAGGFKVNRIKIFEDNATDFEDPTYNPLQLSEVIQFTETADMQVDDSEELFVRISEVSVDGVEFVWAGSPDPSPIVFVEVDGGEDYYEIPVTALELVEVQPTQHSNVDFEFKVEGIVRDTADLSTGTEFDERSLGVKTVFVDIKGVADEPDVVLDNSGPTTWALFDDGDAKGIETTIPENGEAVLSFSAVSGELADQPLDDSESLTVILSNIPEGVEIVDGDGASVDLVFVGYDDNGQPTYEADITNLNFDSGIKVVPTESATDNIVLTGTIVVTENDGHVRAFEREIRVKVEPVIDMEDYSRGSRGFEDELININWAPSNTDRPDSDEIFTRVEISGIPDGATVFVDGSEVTISGGVLVVEPAGGQSEEDFSATALASGYIQILPPEDSSTDMLLTTKVTVKEYDAEYVDNANPGEGIAVASDDPADEPDQPAITGTLTVEVVPVVEPDTDISVVKPNGNPAGTLVDTEGDGVISFVINDLDAAGPQDEVLLFEDLDPDSVERIDRIIIDLKPEVFLANNGDDYLAEPEELYELINGTTPTQAELDAFVAQGNDALLSLLEDAFLDQFFVTDALNNGDGTWTILDPDNFNITVPNGMALGDNIGGSLNSQNTWTLGIVAQVVDDGDPSENEQSAPVLRETTAEVKFPSYIADPTDIASEVEQDMSDEAVVTGTEDNSFDLSDALFSPYNGTDSILSVINGDTSDDDLTIVVDPSDLPAGSQVSGAIFDYVDNVWVFKADVNSAGEIENYAGFIITPPEDFAGDFILPVKVVTTDTTSGDQNIFDFNIPVAIHPVVDVEGSAQPTDSDITPELSVAIKATYGLDADKQPTDLSNDTPITDGKGYEDGLIELDLSVSLADTDITTDEGEESITSITLTLADSDSGEFTDASGNPLGDELILSSDNYPNANFADLESALGSIFFKPAENYPTLNDSVVQIDIAGTITDSAKFDETNAEALFGLGNLETIGGEQHIEVEQPFSGSVSFEVTPVLDPVVISGSEPGEDILVVGDEDTWISLGQGSSGLSIALGEVDDPANLTDNSEQFVSVKITGIPEDFLLQSISTDYTVKNNGGGEWSIRLNDASVSSIALDDIQIKPAEQFSGEVDLGVAVYVQEAITAEPVEFTADFTLKVNPVADTIDTDVVQDTIFVSEGEDIIIDLNASLVDTEESIGDGPNYEENDPEQVRITIDDVPFGASITIGDVTLTQADENGVDPLVFDIPQGTLIVESMTFNSGEYNQDNWAGQLTVTIQSTDTGLDGTVSLGTPVVEVLDVVVSPVNDRPEVTITSSVDSPEDNPAPVTGFKVEDIDSTLDDPSAPYELTLSVGTGDLDLDAGLLATHNIGVESSSALTVTISGTVSDLNDFIAAEGVIYNPVEHYYGNVDITIVADDLGNNGEVIATDDSTSNVSAPAVLTLNITPVNDQPTTDNVVLDDITEDSGSIQITVTELLSQADDIETDVTNLVVTALDVTDSAMGVVVDQGGGVWTFTPADDFYGEVTFDYVITDNGATDTGDNVLDVAGTASLNVLPENDMPETSNVTLADVLEDSGSTQITQADLLAQASDVETDVANLVVSSFDVTDSAMGVVVDQGGGVWTFTPADDFYGEVTFDYVITDDGATNNSDNVLQVAGTASLDVLAVNDAPTVDVTAATSVIDEAIGQKITGISIADIDYDAAHSDDDITVTLAVDDGLLSVSPASPSGVAVTAVTNGVELVGSPGDINALLSDADPSNGVFVDASGVSGFEVELTVTVNDGGVYYENAAGMALEAEESFTISVTPAIVNDAPTLSFDSNLSYGRQIFASRAAANQGIALIGLVAMLVDSNEVLSIEISGVHEDASIVSDNGAISVTDLGGGVWSLTASDPALFNNLEGVTVVDLPDDQHTLDFVAVSTESDGSEARSQSESVSISVGNDANNFDIEGEANDSWIIGRANGSEMIGGDGDDVIQGGNDDDILIGGPGDDLLIGGGGEDIFRWTEDSVSEGSTDTIQDFSLSDGDVIDLRDVIEDLSENESIADILDNVSERIEARLVDDNVELDITTDDDVHQTIVVENVGTQVNLSGLDSDGIVNALLQNNIIQHGS
ncbi:cadherin-like domain-containing protein [Vibrio astriarenae]